MAILIIFGWRVVFFTLSRGTFHCPNCGGDRAYRRRQGRNFFTLFFIPVIPLTKAGGEIVECDSCKGRWHPGVLDVPTTAQLAQMPGMLLRMAIAQVLRSGDYIDAASRSRAVAVVQQAGVAGYDDAALNADLARPLARCAPRWRTPRRRCPGGPREHPARRRRDRPHDGRLSGAERGDPRLRRSGAEPPAHPRVR